MPEAVIVDKKPAILELKPGSYFWCSCGKSKTQPFCDGAHTGTGFSPVLLNIEAEKKVALCLCKQTKGAPFCDGTHSGL